MSAKRPNKRFDCLAFKDRVQTEIYEETKYLSRAELRAYFRRRVETGPFAGLWKSIRKGRTGGSRSDR